MELLGIGDIKIVPTMDSKAGSPIILCNILHAPEVMHNLLSLTKVIATGNKILLYGDWLKIKDNSGSIQGKTQKVGNLYHLQGQMDRVLE